MGEDRHGNLFWYFGGIHLYKQVVKNDTWEVIARSKTEWRQVRDSYSYSSDKEEVWFRETIEQNFDPNLSDIEKETRTWAKKRRIDRTKKLEKKGKRKHKKISRGLGDVQKQNDEHLEEEFDALAARLGMPKLSDVPNVIASSPPPSPSPSSSPPPPQPPQQQSRKPKKEHQSKVVKAQRARSPSTESQSSDSSLSEEELKPESPGVYEIVPGSSKTRPQFIKIRPGETLESALEGRNVTFAVSTEPVRTKQRRNSTKSNPPSKRGRPPKSVTEPKRATRPPKLTENDSSTDSETDMEAPPPISARSKFAQIERARSENKSKEQSEDSSYSDRNGL